MPSEPSSLEACGKGASRVHSQIRPPSTVFLAPFPGLIHFIAVIHESRRVMLKKTHIQTKKVLFYKQKGQVRGGLETRLQVSLLSRTAFFHVLAGYVRSVSLIPRPPPPAQLCKCWAGGLGMRLRSVSSNQIAAGFEFCSLIGYTVDALPTGSCKNLVIIWEAQ